MTDREHEPHDEHDGHGGHGDDPTAPSPEGRVTAARSWPQPELEGEIDEHGFYRLEDRYDAPDESRYEAVSAATAPGPDRSNARRRIDPLALAVGLAALWSAGFFLSVSEPSLRDQGNGLWPPLLIITGVTLVLATTLQRR